MSNFKETVINEIKRQGWAKEERDAIMAEMKRHLGERKPEVGSFFYDMEKKKLMLVDTVPEEIARDSGWGRKTTDKLHREVWSENDMEGDYMDTPRGRVFYNTNTDQYEIMVGDWQKDAPNVKDLVIKRFHLEDKNVVVKQDEHWDIGNGFEGL